MKDLTVIYYTSNREKPAFEERIRRTLWKTIKPLRLPLISVSHKPIDFGENVCVGDVGVSSQNVYRQMQLGALAAKTRFVCCAESDYIYPREYFLHRPDSLTVFSIALPLWVLFAQTGKSRVFALKPRGSEAAMVVGRETLINRVELVLKDVGMWGNTRANGETMPYLTDTQRSFDVDGVERDTFTLPTPLITFKTDEQMHNRTPHDVQSKTRELAPYGSAWGLIKRYLG